MQPWTRIFNIEAGHFDSQTAYAAANTLRIHDMHPHFWRTHDGGKTWTEINSGIAPDAVANSIREDPRQRGLLYAATDNQVWVSYDDGDHWESLRLNMPAISVRDIQVKDDTTCLCADLIAGTHGRGFWILDDLTPLRQMAALRRAQASKLPYLVRPATAARVRFGNNEPTPWPPELPAGENPPSGAVIDYFLPAAPAALKLEVVNAAGRVVRTYASDDPVLDPDPALDPTAYDKVCRQKPSAPDCGLPLYWPAARRRLSAEAGMHRFTWDMRYQPLTPPNPQIEGEVDATGAVPHRSERAPAAPWVPPGRYTLRLIVDGKPYTQPLTLRLDPRVKASTAGLRQLDSLRSEMYTLASRAHSAHLAARALADSASGTLRARIDSLAPVQAPVRGRGRTAPPPTLEGAAQAALAAALAMDGADLPPTAAQIAACGRARTQVNQVLARWARVKAGM
jgi:hypothetical protein